MIVECKCYERRCEHYIGVRYLVEEEESSERHFCYAFPKGIQLEIVNGDDLHMKPREGDAGIVFKPLARGADWPPRKEMLAKLEMLRGETVT